jgi:hypothetical protein
VSLKDLADLATILGVIAIPLSAYIIWLQLRQQTRLARIANTQALVELSSPFNLQLIQDRRMAEFWVEGSGLYPTYDPVDQYRFKSLLIWWLMLHENIFFQWKKEMLDDESYNSWQYDLRVFVQNQLGDRWSEIRASFQADFVKHVEKLIGEGRHESVPSSD